MTTKHRCDRYSLASLPGVEFCRKAGARAAHETIAALTQQVADLNAQLAAVERERDEARAIHASTQTSLEATRLERDEAVRSREEWTANALGGADEARELEGLLAAAQADCDALRTRLDYAESAREDLRGGLARVEAERDQLAAQLREMTTQVERLVAAEAAAFNRAIELAARVTALRLATQALLETSYGMPEFDALDAARKQGRAALATSAAESDAFVAGVRRPILGALAEVLPWARAWVQHGEKQYGPNHDMRHAIDVAQSLLAPTPTKTGAAK